MNYNVNEYGQKVYANFNEDISASTKSQITLQPMIGNSKVFDAVVGTVNITIDDEKLLANQYIEYTLKAGDLNNVGQWRSQGSVLIAGVVLKKTNYKRFTVLA